MLTLQLLKIMDDVWLRKGLDLGLTPYRVIATGVNELQEGLGMIEVVLNADTTAGIQHEFGGGAMGAFKQTPIYDYLAKHNPGEAELAAAKETFMRSSAGYCVATYIMGIGDRHNGNIMVTKDGHLFHIDFGHFLGNFKSKFGYKRERTPFVFTPEMAYVIGGKNFQQDEQYRAFQALCVQAFNALRTRGALLETLFACMVSAGMPELLCEEDVMYMRDQLLLTLSDEEAGVEFLKQVNASVTATSRRLDNFIHIAKHA
jgi:phosphatidylinositol-4,5-bisphosphate 3-kinase